MSTTVTEIDNQGVIEIRDPEIDVADIMRRIRQNMAVRQRLPPLAAALGRTRLGEERAKLRRTIQNLQAHIGNYGTLDTRWTGWRAKVELLIKKCIRKVVARYIAQQQEVHRQLLEVVHQLAGYVDQQEEVLHRRFDQCDRQLRDTAILVRQAPIVPLTGNNSGEAIAA
jgi:hypothetical protein